MSTVPEIANTFIPLDEIKQIGHPSSDLFKPNYNKLLVLHGNAYDLGYQLGKQLGNDIEKAVRWTILSSIQFGSGSKQKLDDSEIDKLINALVIINSWLYDIFYSKGLPKEYQIEANAVVSGAHDAGYLNITIGHVSVINFMADLVNSLINAPYHNTLSLSDQLKIIIREPLETNYHLLSENDRASVNWFFNNYGKEFNLVHHGCDAYNTSDKCDNPKYRYFTRFLQFPSVGYLFYDIVYPVIRRPTDGRYQSIGWLIPGMIGSYTLMNQYGVCTALNYFRSEAVSIGDSKLNMIIIMRMITDYAKNTQEGIKILKENKRGSPYFITIYDGHDIAVCEVYGSGANLKKPKEYITDPNIKKIIPCNCKLFKNSPPVEDNVIVRRPSFEINDKLFVNTNKQLFDYAGVYKPDINLESGFIFPSWESEEFVSPVIANNYYLMPISLPRNLIVQTNNALTPVGRTLQMGSKSNSLSKHTEAISWRYSTLSKLIPNADGMSVNDTLEIPNYISPFINPAYPSNAPFVDAGIPLGLVPVQCVITVYHPHKRIVYLKAGPWQNPWIKFSF